MNSVGNDIHFGVGRGSRDRGGGKSCVPTQPPPFPQLPIPMWLLYMYRSTIAGSSKNKLYIYSIIWDFLLSQINIWTTTTWSNVWVVLPKPSSWVLNWVLDMNTHFKVFASYNILQYLCDFIHVLIFVIVSKCWKRSKLMNIVINSKNKKPCKN